MRKLFLPPPIALRYWKIQDKLSHNTLKMLLMMSLWQIIHSVKSRYNRVSLQSITWFLTFFTFFVFKEYLYLQHLVKTTWWYEVLIMWSTSNCIPIFDTWHFSYEWMPSISSSFNEERLLWLELKYFPFCNEFIGLNCSLKDSSRLFSYCKAKK